MSRIRFVLTASIVLACVAAGCGGDDESGGVSKPKSKPTAGQRFCSAVKSSIQACGASDCDQALVDDCADVAGIFSDAYLNAATDCLKTDSTVTACMTQALGSLEPTDAHRHFADQFCSECAHGLPGCTDAFFDGQSGDTSAVGKVVEAFGDSLVGELTDQCATGLTCAATFVNCAQGVLVNRALPDNIAQCLIGRLMGSSGSDPGCAPQ